MTELGDLRPWRFVNMLAEWTERVSRKVCGSHKIAHRNGISQTRSRIAREVDAWTENQRAKGQMGDLRGSNFQTRFNNVKREKEKAAYTQ
jgi:hypothetical protein